MEKARIQWRILWVGLVILIVASLGWWHVGPVDHITILDPWVMNRMQESFSRAAAELHLQVEIGYVATLAGGRQVTSQARFPDLGSPKATVVFRSEAEVASVRRELVALGFGDSIMDEPAPGETFDLESYADMFAEWVWTGRLDKKPAWMD